MPPSLAKGTAYLTFSGLIFMGSGYIVQLLIGRFFDPAIYGTFGVVLYLLNIINTILASGFFQGISRSISEKESAAKTILKKGLKIEIILTGAFGLIYFLLSKQIAHIFNDPDMAHYIRLTALIIPIYGIRTVYTGLLNGLKRFDKQALAQITAAFVKLGLVAVFLYLKLSLGTIILAYFFAALASLTVSFLFSKIKDGLAEYSGKKLLKTTLAISVYSFSFPLLMSVDLFLVKYFVKDASLAGYYNSATTLARFLYVLFSGFIMSLLPIVSGHFYKSNLEKVQLYCRRAFRFGIMFLLPFSIIASLTSSCLLPFVFSDKYSSAAGPFSILIFGVALLTITRIGMTLIVAVGKQNLSLYFTLSLLVLSVILNYLFIPNYGIEGAAWATTSAGIIGLILALTYLKVKLKKVINWLSTFRIILASTVIGFASYFLADMEILNGFWIVLWYIVLVLVYIFLLWLMKEISSRDISAVKEIVVRKNKNNVGIKNEVE